MNIAQMFASVFGDKLKPFGFHFKSDMAYRVSGDILQGMVLESLQREYFIRYIQIPYWCFRLAFPDISLTDKYWPSTGIISSESVLVSKRRANGCEEGMIRCCQSFCEEILPVMEQVYDDKSFLDAPKRIVSREPTECYSLLYLSHLYGTWEYAQNWLSNRKAEEILREELLLQKRWNHVQPRNPSESNLFEKHFQPIYDEQKRKIPESVDKVMHRRYQKVFERMEIDDFDWIKDIHNNEKAHMQAKIKSELNLTV